MLKVGDSAPDFDVQDHSGNMVQLSSFTGKRVLMWFYPRASTGG